MRKKPRTVLTLAAATLAGGLSLTALAQKGDVPEKDAAAQEATQPQTEAQTQTVTYFGVGTAPLPPELSAHIDVPDGAGLLIVQVADDSPASEAGVKANDVLVRLDDQMLINSDQLGVLVRMHKPGDKVKFSVIRAGKPTGVSVELGQRELTPAELHPMGQRFFEGRRPGVLELRPLQQRPEELGDLMRQQADLMRELQLEQQKLGDQHPAVVQLRRAIEDMERERQQNPYFGEFRPFPNDGGAAMPFDSATTNIIVSDVIDGTAATLQVRDGEKQFKIERDGETLFDGPVNTDEQREGLAPDQQTRLEKLEQMLPTPVTPSQSPSTAPAAPAGQGKGTREST